MDLQNLKFIYKGREVLIITDDENNPWFKSKDICTSLDYERSRDAIKYNVFEEDKVKYKNFNVGELNSPINIHPNTIFINESGLYSLILNSKKEEAKEFKQFLDINLPILKNNLKLKNYNKIDNFKNIFDYINSQNYTIKLGNWFKDIWIPLFDQKNIIITNNILNFLYNQSFFNEYDYEENEEFSEENDINPDNDDEITGASTWTPLGFKNKKENNVFLGLVTVPDLDFANIKQDYIKFLKKNDINFTKIKYNENLIKEYNFLEEDIKNLENKNRVQKTWIYMTVKDFKESVMLLNTDNAKEVKKYYITLEEILFDYMKYTKDYEIKKSEYEKIEKENKMLELESDFNNQLSLKDKELSIKDEKLKKMKKKLNN